MRVDDPRARQFYPILFNGPSWGTDFTPQWYQNVGTQLVLSIASNALVYPIFSILTGPIDFVMRLIFAPMSKTQSQLNRAWLPSAFTLDYRYGQLLSMIFMAFTISPGIPLAVPLLVIYLLLTYGADIFVLLRVTQRPTNLSDELARMLTGALPWVAWINLAVGFWMFGEGSMVSFSAEI